MPTPGLMPRLRDWLRSDMRILRWVFALLYVGILVTLILWAACGNDLAAMLTMCGINVAAQALLIFGAGTMRLCRPIRKRRLILPALIAGLAFAVLLAGLTIAMEELFKLDRLDRNGIGFFAIFFGSWAVWTVLIVMHARQWARHTFLARVAAGALAGSLAELLATIPAHLVVIRRPGCLVGIGTMLGIIAGLNVMFFSFGPAIILLFLRPRHRRELADTTPYCPNCGRDLPGELEVCPHCHRPTRPPAFPVLPR